MGAKGIYPFGDFEEGTPIFFVYPKAEISYKSGSGKWVPFINYRGSYDLNSFTAFSLENPFVAPTLTIKPTQVNHHCDLGFNTYPGSGLSFRLNAHDSQHDNFPLFKRLPYDQNNKDMAAVWLMPMGYYDNIEKMAIVTDRNAIANTIKLVWKRDILMHQKWRSKVWNLPSLKIDFNATMIGTKIIFKLERPCWG